MFELELNYCVNSKKDIREKINVDSVNKGYVNTIQNIFSQNLRSDFFYERPHPCLPAGRSVLSFKERKLIGKSDPRFSEKPF